MKLELNKENVMITAHMLLSVTIEDARRFKGTDEDVFKDESIEGIALTMLSQELARIQLFLLNKGFSKEYMQATNNL